MAKRTIAAGYEYLGGSSRRYRVIGYPADAETGLPIGSTISRERYEALHGTLAARGQTGFKRASAAVPEEQRQARPARGRRIVQGDATARRRKPKKGHRWNDIKLETEIIITDDPDDMEDQTEIYRDRFYEIMKGIAENPNVVAAGFRVYIPNHDPDTLTLYQSVDKDNLIASDDTFFPGLLGGGITSSGAAAIPFDGVMGKIAELGQFEGTDSKKGLLGLEIKAFVFYMLFHENLYIPRKRRKVGVRLTKGRFANYPKFAA